MFDTVPTEVSNMNHHIPEIVPKVLIVDDREENILATKKVLKSLEMEVYEATSGNEALSIMLRHDFAVVLLDVQMPEMDGFEVAKLMREHEDMCDTPIVFMTAISKEDRYATEAGLIGAVDYIFKPINSEILKSKVRTYTELYVQQERVSLLNSALKKQNEDLETARQRAEASSKAKSEFLANMSHELRTPMNSITGTSDLLAITKLDEQQRKYVETIISSSNVLLGIINDILNLSKIESGTLHFDSEKVVVGDLFKEVVDSFQENAKAKKVSLDIKDGINEGTVLLADPLRLRQVLSNLIANAIKFTHKGHILIDVKEKRRDRKMLCLHVAVQDTGIGIAKEKMRAIFEKFMQVDNTSTRQYGGVGLGLTICKSLVEAMGGEMGVESEPEKGSNFWFELTLPLADPLPQSKKTIQKVLSADQLPQYNLRVLIVEDLLENKTVIEDIFSRFGCRAEHAFNGEEALELLDKDKVFDLILMDCQMPKMDGYEATEAIRERKWGKKLKIIALTAHALPSDKEKCLESGMDDYLTKPLRMNDVGEKLQEYFTVKAA